MLPGIIQLRACGIKKNILLVHLIRRIIKHENITLSPHPMTETVHVAKPKNSVIKLSYEEYKEMAELILHHFKKSKGISKMEIIAWCIEEGFDCDGDSQVGMKL